MKICSGCKKSKPSSKFHKVKNRLRSQCIDCLKQKRNVVSTKEQRWRSRGIDLSYDEYVSMEKDQESLCAICGNHEATKNRQLAVDHDHETGRIRGLLCYSCNTKLGWLEKYFDKVNSYLALKEG